MAMYYTPQLYVLGGPTFPPGQELLYIIPVTSLSTVEARVKVKVIVSAHSPVLPDITLKELWSSEQTLSPNHTRPFTVSDIAVSHERVSRSFGVEVYCWIGSAWEKRADQVFHDVYYVSAAAYQFQIGQPTVRSAG